MLRHTFQHISGITARREREFWSSGVLDWATLAKNSDPQSALFNDSSVIGKIPAELARSSDALSAGDVAYFGTRLDRREHFRIALSFPTETLFLDIETTGLSRYYDHITVIGWSLGEEYGFFVKGQSIEGFRAAVCSAKAIVTFNGSLFDVPFIRQEYPDINLPEIHIDLRFLAKRVEITGGQKKIERMLELARPPELDGILGESAPTLWSDYVRGDLDALDILLRYNAADISGMKYIMDEVITRILNSQGFPKNEIPIPKFAVYHDSESKYRLDGAIAASLRPWPERLTTKVRLDDLGLSTRDQGRAVVGIDLTGSEVRPSGWCLLKGNEATTARVSTDDELISKSIACRPNLISIDSPLSLPTGRVSAFDSDPGRNEYGIMRFCERQLKRRGVNVYPALLPSMQRLTDRGIRLAKRFRELGYPVIESYPGAAQDIIGIPRKQKGLSYLRRSLSEFGLSGDFVINNDISHDELDAITSALVGLFFWANKIERLGPDPLGEEALFIPDLKVDATSRRRRLIMGLSGGLGAGKTTASRRLESLGFTYCRYSQVIEKLVSERKLKIDRSDLQAEGQRVHVEMGQRWLGRELIRLIAAERLVVIDGLRFPDDHAFLTEIFGARFVHVNIVADRSNRKSRYESREGADFEQAEAHPVEGRADALRQLASVQLNNDGSIQDLYNSLDLIIAQSRE